MSMLSVEVKQHFSSKNLYLLKKCVFRKNISCYVDFSNKIGYNKFTKMRFPQKYFEVRYEASKKTVFTKIDK